MRFLRVAAQHFRLFEQFEFAPQPGVNLILGANAAGKTTVLEALYVLGRGRGFRGAAPELADAAGSWTVHGRIAAAGDRQRAVGVAWSKDGLRLRLDEADATLQDVVQALPVQVLEPDSHRLLEDGPIYRRRFLDWGVFHVEHRFFPAWRAYQRALKQRNHALKTTSDRAAIEAWNDELVRAGEDVHRYREEHVHLLHEPLREQIQALLGDAEWSLELSPGWSAALPLARALAEHYEHDCRQRSTLAGPHRAELRLRFAGHAAKHHASRGQQKLLIAALLLAQAHLVESRTGDAPALLIDDFPAELGPQFQAALLLALERYPGQSFVTAIELTAALETVPKNALFHVEQRSISGPSRV